jgi:hypothetical protein
MEDRTRAIIELLAVAEWFSSVGQPVSEVVTQVSSWSMAFELCDTLEWENTEIEARNELLSAMHLHNKNLEWNPPFGEISSTTGPLVRQKLAQFSEQSNLQLPKTFVSSVRWSITTIAMSTEFSHIFTPTFYADLAYWYVKGHFPCGWDGDYPQGRLIIY